MSEKEDQLLIYLKSRFTLLVNNYLLLTNIYCNLCDVAKNVKSNQFNNMLS